MPSIIKFSLRLNPLSRVSFGIITLAISLTSCATNQQANTTKPMPRVSAVSPPANLPKVVVTHSVLCDITKEIAQTTIDLQCLVTGGTDPHEYKATPEDKRAIEQAKLILYGGYGFEPGLIKMIQSSQTPVPKIAVSELAVPKPLKGATEHNQANDQAAQTQAKSQDQDHSEFDPHIWQNAQYGVQMVQVVKDQLKTISPENASLFTTNAEKLTKNLQLIDAWIKNQVQTIPAEQKQLITTHESMSYFAAAYGIKLEGALQGITTEEQPTATRVAELVQAIKSAKVPTIFPEANINPSLMKVVAKEAKVKVAETPIFGDGLGEPGSAGDTYGKMLTTNTCTIVNGLGGKCTPLTTK